jgi:hypothetical protein
MQLVLKRSRVLAGQFVQFRLDYQLVLAPHEEELAAKYGWPDFSGFWSDNASLNSEYFQKMLRDGASMVSRDYRELLDFEHKLTDRCKGTANYWNGSALYTETPQKVVDI